MKNTSARLIEQLENNARLIPQKDAIIFHEDKINYRQLNNLVNKVAGAFWELGVRKGDHVAVMLPRIPELVVSYLAIARIQAIAVPINFEFPENKINALLHVIAPRCLVSHDSFVELAKKSLSDSFQMPIICVGTNDRACISWDQILNNGSIEVPRFDIKEDDIVYLNYTSGSTGNPKGAITTHANIYYNTLASVDSLDMTSEDVHLCMFAPFAHPHEIFARPLYLGGTMVLFDKIYPKSMAEAIAHHRITCIMGLAPMYENLLEVLEHKAYDLSSLRVPESGGMYTRTKLIERFREKTGVPIIPVWGSTETTGIAIANRPKNQIKPGSVGKPCKYYEVKIVDEQNQNVPVGQIGELIFRGPANVSGYYEQEKNINSCFKDGWYYSGDLGKVDEEGNFYFVERKTGMMKVAGLKVYPLEVEIVLGEHPDIKEAAVISVKDRLRGEVPKAIIVPRLAGQLEEKEIIGFCKERLAHYQIPKVLEIRDSLPKTSSGKINKKELQLESV